MIHADQMKLLQRFPKWLQGMCLRLSSESDRQKRDLQTAEAEIRRLNLRLPDALREGPLLMVVRTGFPTFVCTVRAARIAWPKVAAWLDTRPHAHNAKAFGEQGGPDEMIVSLMEEI